MEGKQYSTLKIPLTRKMVEFLMDIHERELLNLEPHNVAMAPSARGLIARGMLFVKPFVTANGKRYLGVYVSDLGRKYLSKL